MVPERWDRALCLATESVDSEREKLSSSGWASSRLWLDQKMKNGFEELRFHYRPR